MWFIFLEYEIIKVNFIKLNVYIAIKDYSNNIYEELKKRFQSTFNFSNNDINEFIFLLKKVVYSDKYMDKWGKFNETSLPEKEELYSNLNMKDITDADYM